jgi:hypothetical protein
LFDVEQTDITSLPEVASALRQAHLDAAFLVFGSACQNRATCLPHVICSGLFQCVNCASFVTEHSCFFDWLKAKGVRNFSFMGYKANYSNKISVQVFDIVEVNEVQ